MCYAATEKDNAVLSADLAATDRTAMGE